MEGTSDHLLGHSDPEEITKSYLTDTLGRRECVRVES